MKKTGKLHVDLSKFVSSTRSTYPSRLVRPLYTTTNRGNPFEKNKHSKRESAVLEKFRLRKLKGSDETDAENKPLPNSSNSDIETEVCSENKKSYKTAEVVSSFQKLGLREEVVTAVEEMDVFVPSEIQSVGVLAILDGKSLVLSSGRTLAWLLPLVQMLGEQLYSLMKRLELDNGGKVTAILLEMDQTRCLMSLSLQMA